MEEGPEPDHRRRNENYWGQKPALKEVVFRFIPDTNTQTASLQSGEVHFINPHPDIGLLNKLRSFEGVKVQVKSGTVWEHVAFNVEAVPNLQDAPGDSLWHKSRADSGRDPEGAGATPLQSVLVPDQTPYYTPAWADYTTPIRASNWCSRRSQRGFNRNHLLDDLRRRRCARRCSRWPSNSGHRHHDKHKEHLGRHLLRPVVARG